MHNMSVLIQHRAVFWESELPHGISSHLVLS